MAMQKRIKVNHEDVFPSGAFLKGVVEPVADFKAERRADGSRPQQVDRETGLLVWQCTVIDADEEAGKRDTAVSVKFLAKVRPVPPENKSALPWTPVVFTGLTALAYVDESGQRPRIAWSFRAEDMVAPTNGSPGTGTGAGTSTGTGTASGTTSGTGSGGAGSKAAA